MRIIITVFLIISLFTIPANAFTSSQHLIVADFLSKQVDSTFKAFWLGFLSHAILELCYQIL